MKAKLLFLLFLFSSILFSQKVTTSIDSTTKKIGSEFKLTLKTLVSKKDKVKFPDRNNFGNLEVLESYKIDTIKSNDNYELIKKYGLTQFDSGKYLIPRLPININGKIVFSDSLLIQINDVKVDTLKQKMYDAKEIIQVKGTNSFINIFLYIFGAIALFFVLFWLIKKYKSSKKLNNKEEAVYKTPIEKATSLLQQLEVKELWQKGEVKTYYSELTDIVRTYIEEEINVPAMESTTSELIMSLRKVAKQKKLKLSKDTLENLEKVLKQADLVKFAKSEPLDFEIKEDKKRIENSILIIHDSIPTIIEQKDQLEALNEEQIELAKILKKKKEKQKRIKTVVLTSLGLFIFSIVLIISIKDTNYLKDLVLGNKTKELVEADWIYSEYGNPGIYIETPEVLERIEAKKRLPKSKLDLVKEMQIFEYGKITEAFYISLATKKLKSKINFGQLTKETLPEVNLDELADESVKDWESVGAQNIIIKQEDFDTSKGVVGKKLFGTFNLSTVNHRIYFEMLLFKQEGGIQQITITYQENDQYGKEVAKRILNSVELKEAEK